MSNDPGQLSLPILLGSVNETGFGWEGKGRYGSFRLWMNAGYAGKTVRSLENACHACALEVCSRQGAIQIHIYLYLYLSSQVFLSVCPSVCLFLPYEQLRLLGVILDAVCMMKRSRAPRLQYSVICVQSSSH